MATQYSRPAEIQRNGFPTSVDMKQKDHEAHSRNEKSVKEHEDKMMSKAREGDHERQEEIQHDVDSCWCNSGFDVLPNELVLDILCLHLEPEIHPICKSVCQRWRLLLKTRRPSSSSLSWRTSRIWAAHLAQRGHLQVLKWARSQGCPWDWRTCAQAAMRGHLEVIQWARSQGCPWDSRTCTNAAGGGHLQVLKWAVEKGCPWDLRGCVEAALKGLLKVLQRLSKSDDPHVWYELTLEEAGYFEVLKWVVE